MEDQQPLGLRQKLKLLQQFLTWQQKDAVLPALALPQLPIQVDLLSTFRAVYVCWAFFSAYLCCLSMCLLCFLYMVCLNQSQPLYSLYSVVTCPEHA